MAGGDLAFIDLNPYLILAFSILEWTGVIPDPISLLLSLFAGRPRAEATIQVGQRLIKAPNPVARKAGLEYLRLLKEWDIVISDSSADGQFLLGKVFSQFWGGLVEQGVAEHRAKEIALFALSRDAQAGAPLEPELEKPGLQGLHLYGDKRIADLAQQAQQEADDRNLTGDQRDNFIVRYILRHVALGQLLRSVWSQHPPAPPPPPGPPPPPPPPPKGEFDPQKCCDETQGSLLAIASAINQVGNSIVIDTPDPSPAIQALGDRLYQVIAQTSDVTDQDAAMLRDAINALKDCVCEHLKKIAEPDAAVMAKIRQVESYMLRVGLVDSELGQVLLS